MQIRVFDVLDRNRKIHCIKHMRHATGYNLSMSKDVVDRLFPGRLSEGILIEVKDSITQDQFREFGQWFEYAEDGQVPKGTLKLFRVIITDAGCSYMSVALSTTRERAITATTDDISDNYSVTLSQLPVITCEEITSFSNGQVLLMSRI